MSSGPHRITYLTVESDGRYDVGEGPMASPETYAVPDLEAASGTANAWIEIEADPSPNARAAVRAAVRRAIERGWRCALRIESGGAQPAGRGDPARLLIGSNGAADRGADCGHATRVALVPGGARPDTVLDIAFDLAVQGCTVTTTISAASPASTPAPAGP